uniref:Nudix hydrolase domain-containing protein n=1 Tax=viral metagenome TaxID=1070528 RepID=A0A6C0HRT6_9ZZZZ
MPGAGILPIAVHKNKIYFLFGKENKYNDTPGWCDFGGGIERGETVFDTSLREIEEESCGFISKKEILESIEKMGRLVYKIKGYTTTIVLINYDKNLPEYFNKNHAIIEKYVPKIIKTSVIFEKDELKWITWDELNIPFRPFYQKMIDNLFKNYKEIEEFAFR